MSNVANVHLGVCDVSFNGVDIGHTKGGVEVSYEPVWHDITVDKFGDTVVERVLRGEKWTAKVPFAEETIANLRVAMPGSTFAGAANTRILLGSSAGKKASTSTAVLVLHPRELQTRQFDIVFYKAHVASPIVVSQKSDEEVIIEVEFTALVDETKADGNYLGLIGDSTT